MTIFDELSTTTVRDILARSRHGTVQTTSPMRVTT